MDFLIEKSPRHVYYSSAYYKTPEALKMQDKEWMGAELIFDLDSDHLPNADQFTYTQQLALVKTEFEKLVEEFLLGDFGFSKKHLELYFSGGRGYHCHVKDPSVFDMDSNERRELVDYITARDLQESVIFHEHITDTRSYGNQKYPSAKSLKMPSPNESGWKGRISQGIIDIVNEIRTADDPEQKLLEYGVHQKDAEKLALELSDERVRRIQNGLLDQSKLIRKFFLNNALRKTAVSLGAGETDEPVTCDVKRLIRLPYSLHGKTGFQVKPIALNELAEFDPLNDAVVLSDELVHVSLQFPVDITLKHQRFQLEPGEHSLPAYLAVFLIGRKQALIQT